MLGAPESPAPTPGGALPPAPRSSGKRWWIGCGLGCLALVALALGAALAGVLWLVWPPRQVPSSALAGPETLAVVQVSDLGRDAGVLEALAALEEAARVAAKEPGREGEGALPWRALASLVPREATAVLERGPDGARAAVALNARVFVRPVRAVLGTLGEEHGWSHERVHGTAVHAYAEGESSLALAFFEGTLLVAADAEALTPLLARLAAWREQGREAAPDAAAERAWDVRFTAQPAPGALESVVAAWLDEAFELPRGPSGERASWSELLEGVLALDGGLDLVDRKHARGELRLEMADPRSAERVRERLEALLASRAEGARERGRELEWTSAASGLWLTFEVEARGLESYWPDALPR